MVCSGSCRFCRRQNRHFLTRIVKPIMLRCENFDPSNVQALNDFL